ncbi:hypothetical protein [Ancylobacter sp. SL191]|uniref:hypothetical protein n=1 Tax=Ancylobacter sp. SL191 TaxID=2995166 RepID=UPI00226F3270|nr:hypothetical protein [Ancylobacter sp. SL191]WAC26388.1 hypothetical protein OU996_15385 [Ancylobacter sp. SL191]
MKLLSDKLLSQIPNGRGEALARELLKMPAVNHASAIVQSPQCERFVFDQAATQILRCREQIIKSRLRDIDRIPTPCDLAWVEMSGLGAWLVRGRSVHGFADVPGAGARYIATMDLDEWPGEMRVISSTYIQTLAAAGYTNLHDWALWTHQVIGALMALASPHTATTRRIEPGPDGGSAQRAFIRRRAQRGQPVFSFNQVEMIIPRAAMHNGVLKTAESFAGMRMHQVIGHWRLIDGVIAPYWVWIEGHQRGDSERGTIVKQRNVRLANEASRRGFPMPRAPGVPGERRPALSPPSLNPETSR